jgi:hypothetical protein
MKSNFSSVRTVSKPVVFYSFLLIAAVALVLLAWLVIYMIYGSSIVPLALYPPFADLITITGSVECMRSGFDPYVYSGCDPWGRLYNYPKIWLNIFDFLGIDRNATNATGIICILLFYTALLPLFRMRNVVEFVTALLFVLSPLVLLLLERGNSDILIFLMVLIAVYYVRKIPFIRQVSRIYISYAIIIIAAILKIYPVFLLLLLFFESIPKKHFIIIFSSALIILGSYFLTCYDELLFISRNTPRDQAISYGRNVLLQNYFSGTSLILITNALLLVVFISAWFAGKKFRGPHVLLKKAAATGDHAELLLFISGGLIFTGTFFIGNNYDYRLVFLLLTLPLLLRQREAGKKLIFALLFLYLIAYYGGFFQRLDILQRLHLQQLTAFVDQVADWLLFFIITLLLIQLHRMDSGVAKNHQKGI